MVEQITVREALLDDARPICMLFRSRIPVWQRLTASGSVESLPYDSLTVYERWTHGGPWMSIETAAIALGRLLNGVGLALVAERRGEIVGYLEAYPGYEPAPFGGHLHLAHLVTGGAAGPDAEIADSLLRRAGDVARHLPDKRLTVSLPSETGDDAQFYRQRGFAPLARVSRYLVPSKAGQGFYKVTEHTRSSVDQIDGMLMAFGRTESASMLWESVWVSVWEVIPQLAQRGISRMKLDASGHGVLICAQPVPHDPRIVDLWGWSARPMNPVLLTALRDWAHREKYHALRLIVDSETAGLFGTDAESDPFSRITFALQV
ncbi:MAG: hypothetical protein J5J04_17445 [Anaerolineae bacterium]|nr:MAG: hypothetical protein UZ13_01661 [Chloroflexi bacterium OLB13]MBC6957437.1 hypothetical protein [Chloroflexota bacterium]MBV6435353.1 hypothetical protein [Anaerolineae bacterium]MDL1917120.1 hypothetical protein [Anaerolineae bacterium CFX4]OQY83023.1 MAG: hypothetical protein B6D42_08390 [Anaerolineae bacterium UTCFX5]